MESRFTNAEAGTRLFSFETKQWTPVPGAGPTPGVCYPMTYLPKSQGALLYLKGQTWIFRSKERRWERIEAKRSPEAHYRAGIAYDSAILGGWKTNEPSAGPDVTPGV